MQQLQTLLPFQHPAWKYVKTFLEHFLYPFYKTQSVFSFGKTWTSVLMSSCFFYWFYLRTDIPETLESMTWAMLAYTFSTKPVQLIRDRANKKTIVGGPEKAADAAAASAEGQS